jgi:hypothetical protein
MPIQIGIFQTALTSASPRHIILTSAASAIMMIRTLQNAALLLVIVSCTTKSASAVEHNDLNKVLSAVILEMNNEGVFADYWYVQYIVVWCAVLCCAATSLRLRTIAIAITVLLIVSVSRLLHSSMPVLINDLLTLFSSLCSFVPYRTVQESLL